MRRVTRLLLIILCASLISGVSPSIVFADSLQPETSSLYQSGEWGTCPWAINDEGVLTIYPGTGADANGSNPWYEYKDVVTKVVFASDGPAKVVAPSDCGALLSDFSRVVEFDLSGLDTSGVSTMFCMFTDCSSVEELDVSSFDISNVERLNGMFSRCTSLTAVNLPSLENLCATGIHGMFSQCTSLKTMDLHDLNAPNAEEIGSIFAGCTALESVNMSSWDVPKATLANSMFSGCTSLRDIDISNWNAPMLRNLNNFFADCTSLTSIDLPSWTAVSPSAMNSMFKNCSSLKSIDVSLIDSAHLQNGISGLYGGCTSLERITVGESSPLGLPSIEVRGHTDWFSTKDCVWLKNYDIANHRRGIADTYTKTGHSFTSYVSDGNATCTEDGTKTAYCDYGCGSTDTIPDDNSALGHDYCSTVIAPVCTESGYTEHVCKRCGDCYRDSYIDATGHSIVGVDFVECTCTEAGMNTHWICEVCNKVFSDPEGTTEASIESVIIPALGHDYKSTITKAATYNALGVETHVCARCGDSYTTTIPKLVKSSSSIKLSSQTKTYTGKVLAYSAKVTKSGSKGKVTFKYYSDAKCTKSATPKVVGVYYVKAFLAEDASHKGATSATVKFTICKAKNPIVVVSKTKAISLTKVKAARQTVVPIAVSKAQGTKSFSVSKWTTAKAKNYFSVNKSTGKVTARKGTPKGTYKFKVKVTAKGTANYKAGSKVVDVVVKVN